MDAFDVHSDIAGMLKCRGRLLSETKTDKISKESQQKLKRIVCVVGYFQDIYPSTIFQNIWIKCHERHIITVALSSTSDRSVTGTSQGHSDVVTSVAFSPDGKQIVLDPSLGAVSKTTMKLYSVVASFR